MRGLWLALVLSVPAAGQPVLPDPAAVEVAISSHPAVAAAGARATAARARAMALGSQEIVATGTIGSRQLRSGDHFPEFEAGVSREIRLPGKGALDRKAGDAGMRAADNLAEDARHQAALLLSDLWWDWLGAAAERRSLAGSASTLEEAARAVRRRLALRDSAAIEVDQAEAALAGARAAARAAAGREAALAETIARTDAWRAITRLKIDSHTLWIHHDARDGVPTASGEAADGT
jgi:outer membrane protein TolC